MPWSFGIGALFYLQKSWNTARRYAIIKELPNLQQKGGDFDGQYYSLDSCPCRSKCN
jgi:hypothetical protein